MRSRSSGLGLLVLLIGLSGCGESPESMPGPGSAEGEAIKKTVENLPGLDRMKAMSKGGFPSKVAPAKKQTPAKNVSP
jgi:hypothetical protein